MKLKSGPWKQMPRTKANKAKVPVIDPSLDVTIITEEPEQKSTAPIMPNKNDGSKGPDGFRIKPQVWTDCTECGRPIYYIKKGAKCVFCK